MLFWGCRERERGGERSGTEWLASVESENLCCYTMWCARSYCYAFSTEFWPAVMPGKRLYIVVVFVVVVVFMIQGTYVPGTRGIPVVRLLRNNCHGWLITVWLPQTTAFTQISPDIELIPPLWIYLHGSFWNCSWPFCEVPFLAVWSPSYDSTRLAAFANGCHDSWRTSPKLQCFCSSPSDSLCNSLYKTNSWGTFVLKITA